MHGKAYAPRFISRQPKFTLIPMQKTPVVSQTIHWLHEIGLLSASELTTAESMFEPRFEFAASLQLADSIHLHIRVDDTDALPADAFAAHGGQFDHGKRGYVKYRFPDGVNAIFSTIPVAQDNLSETEDHHRPRPHLDHIGIDLRREAEPVKSGFDHVPDRAGSLGWGHIPQGGKGRPVYCCHIEVAAKHWVYPPDDVAGPGIPLEFAYGPLKTNDFKAGCDLRPAAPVVHLAAQAK
jgi:hypothetical protein